MSDRQSPLNFSSEDVYPLVGTWTFRVLSWLGNHTTQRYTVEIDSEDVLAPIRFNVVSRGYPSNDLIVERAITKLAAKNDNLRAELAGERALREVDTNSFREVITSLQSEITRLQDEVYGWELSSRGFP